MTNIVQITNLVHDHDGLRYNVSNDIANYKHSSNYTNSLEWEVHHIQWTSHITRFPVAMQLNNPFPFPFAQHFLNLAIISYVNQFSFPRAIWLLPADVVHKIVFLQPLLQHEFSLQPIKSEVHFTNLHNTWRKALDMNNRAKHPLSTLSHLQHTNRIEYLTYPLISPLISWHLNILTNTTGAPTKNKMWAEIYPWSVRANEERRTAATKLPVLRLQRRTTNDSFTSTTLPQLHHHHTAMLIHLRLKGVL